MTATRTKPRTKSKLEQAVLTPEQHRRTIITTIQQLGYRHSTWRVFSDFLEFGAISLSNAVDYRKREEREARYLQMVKQYSAEEMQLFPTMLGSLMLALEGGFDDVLGRVYMELELGNEWAGQFFTPYHLCQMMAEMTMQDAPELLKTQEFITLHEPCVGGGAFVIAAAECLRKQKINYQQKLHVMAVDVDIKCVHMAYIQLALLHVPAIIICGNSLSLEERDQWYTPAHILGGWSSRLRRRQIEQREAQPVEARPDPAPDQFELPMLEG